MLAALLLTRFPDPLAFGKKKWVGEPGYSLARLSASLISQMDNDWSRRLMT